MAMEPPMVHDLPTVTCTMVQGISYDFLLPLPCPCDFVSTYALLR